MWIIAVSILGSIAASIVTAKILATRYFKIVDKYVDDICSKTKDFVETVKHEIGGENNV